MNHKSTNPDQPSCVLLCGRVDFFDYDTLKQIAQYYNVIISGQVIDQEVLLKKPSRKIHIYNEDPTQENFAKIVYSYSPDTVWYFTGYIDGGEGLTNENKMLEALFEACSVNEVSKLVVISSVNSLLYKSADGRKTGFFKDYKNERAYDCGALEDLIRYNSLRKSVKTVILRTSHIANRANEATYLGNLYNTAVNTRKVDFLYNENQLVDFMTVRDLCELLISVTEETMDASGSYTALSGYRHTYGEFGEELKKSIEGLNVTYDKQGLLDYSINRKEEERRIRENYGFIAADDVVADLDGSYGRHRKKQIRKKSVQERLKELAGRFSQKLLKLTELILLFVIVQYLLRYTTDTVFFKYVDLRLFYVVIMGVAHGMVPGVLAGLLECVSLAVSYWNTGVSSTMLFYNVDFWLPFAIYLMTGAITGYMTSTKDQKQAFAEEEVATLQEKYMFLNSVYMSVIDNKEEYKKQILGYQDSFGKIFDAVQKLDSSVPSDIFVNGISTLERILENHSVAIYSMDEYQKYLRLTACSKEMAVKLTNSVSIEDFRAIYDTLLSGETFKNTEFNDELPMYAYAVTEGGKIRLMITLFDADTEQMNLYYMNLFTILCSLIRVSFMRALEYQEAIEDEKYYPGTQVLIPEFFKTELEAQRKMAEAGVASCILLKLDDDEIGEVDEKMRGLIRHSDLLGRGEDGGNYLLLTQTTADILDIVGKRFKGKGIGYTVMEGM